MESLSEGGIWRHVDGSQKRGGSEAAVHGVSFCPSAGCLRGVTPVCLLRQCWLSEERICQARLLHHCHRTSVCLQLLPYVYSAEGRSGVGESCRAT